MKAISIRIVQRGLITLMLICGLVAVSALGQSGGDYTLKWSTIDGGGGQSSGGPYELVGTIGQPDAAYSAGGNYELLGGFWPGGPLCMVSFDDFARFAELWRDSGDDLPADLDGSGEVDFADLKDFAYLWLKCCPIGWPLK